MSFDGDHAHMGIRVDYSRDASSRPSTLAAPSMLNAGEFRLNSMTPRSTRAVFHCGVTSDARAHHRCEQREMVNLLASSVALPPLTPNRAAWLTRQDFGRAYV